MSLIIPFLWLILKLDVGMFQEMIALVFLGKRKKRPDNRRLVKCGRRDLNPHSQDRPQDP